MSERKPGQRLKSAVCDAEVMIIKAEGSEAISCGGAPMLGPDDAAADAVADPDQMTGCEVGKRYVNAGETMELLCVKAGAGTLAIEGAPLQIKGAKNLPSSD